MDQVLSARGHNVDPWSGRCRLCTRTLFEITEIAARGGPKTCDGPRQSADVPSFMRARPRLIYVSGPLTTGQLTANVREALRVGKQLIDAGYAVIVPHEKLLTEILYPMSYDEWLTYDFRIILCCDAVLRIEGESHGGDAEVKFAREHGIPVYFSLDTLYACERNPIGLHA